MNKCNLIYLFAVSLLVITACGDDAAPPSNNNSETTEKSSYDLESKDSDGKTVSIKGEPEGGSKESGGASIADASLDLFFVDSSGKTVLVTVESTQTQTLPGTFKVKPNIDGSGTYITWVTAEGVYEGKSGTISLSNCPTRIGEQAVGEFNSVVLESLTGGASRTIDGKFTLPVFQKNGDLFCAKTEDANNGSKNNGEGGSCLQYEECNGTNGACCEKQTCIRSCQQNCILNECLLNLSDCLACNTACFDSCDAPETCKSAVAALNTCIEDEGCSDDELSFTCVKGMCCEELQGAW